MFLGLLVRWNMLPTKQNKDLVISTVARQIWWSMKGIKCGAC
jgi:hypothetical protein